VAAAGVRRPHARGKRILRQRGHVERAGRVPRGAGGQLCEEGGITQGQPRGVRRGLEGGGLPGVSGVPGVPGVPVRRRLREPGAAGGMDRVVVGTVRRDAGVGVGMGQRVGRLAAEVGAARLRVRRLVGARRRGLGRRTVHHVFHLVHGRGRASGSGPRIEKDERGRRIRRVGLGWGLRRGRRGGVSEASAVRSACRRREARGVLWLGLAQKRSRRAPGVGGKVGWREGRGREVGVGGRGGRRTPGRQWSHGP